MAATWASRLVIVDNEIRTLPHLGDADWSGVAAVADNGRLAGWSEGGLGYFGGHVAVLVALACRRTQPAVTTVPAMP